MRFPCIYLERLNASNSKQSYSPKEDDEFLYVFVAEPIIVLLMFALLIWRQLISASITHNNVASRSSVFVYLKGTELSIGKQKVQFAWKEIERKSHLKYCLDSKCVSPHNERLGERQHCWTSICWKWQLTGMDLFSPSVWSLVFYQFFTPQLFIAWTSMIIQIVLCTLLVQLSNYDNSFYISTTFGNFAFLHLIQIFKRSDADYWSTPWSPFPAFCQ